MSPGWVAHSSACQPPPCVRFHCGKGEASFGFSWTWVRTFTDCVTAGGGWWLQPPNGSFRQTLQKSLDLSKTGSRFLTPNSTRFIPPLPHS